MLYGESQISNGFQQVVSKASEFDRPAGIIRDDLNRVSHGKEIRPQSYSYRSASIGSSRAALIAGSIPLTIPTTLKITVDAISVPASIFK